MALLSGSEFAPVVDRRRGLIWPAPGIAPAHFQANGRQASDKGPPQNSNLSLVTSIRTFCDTPPSITSCLAETDMERVGIECSRSTIETSECCVSC